MTSRKAEARAVRSWQGTVASANDLENDREWVVWGVGREAPSVMGGEPGNDIAEAIAKSSDSRWAAMGLAERWVIRVAGEESVVEDLLEESGSALGHAPYLAPGKHEEVSDARMRGTLRGDVAPRRKVDQRRPYGGG